MSRQMQDRWGAFAQGITPGMDWQPAGPDGDHAILLELLPTNISGYRNEYCGLWDELRHLI